MAERAPSPPASPRPGSAARASPWRELDVSPTTKRAYPHVRPLDYGESGGWAGPSAASNEQVARSQSYGFAARQLRKAIDRLAQEAATQKRQQHIDRFATQIYPAAAALLRQLNFLAESLSGMLRDVERLRGHSRDPNDGTATPLTYLARGAADACVVEDFRQFRERLQSIAMEYEAFRAAETGGQPRPAPTQVVPRDGTVQPELPPLAMPMAAVERSISSTRRKFNDACCNFVRLIHQPDLGVIIEQHVTVIDMYRCRRASLGCREWCDSVLNALPRLAFVDTRAGRIETISLAPGQVKWERPLYQPPPPEPEAETAEQPAQGAGAGAAAAAAPAAGQAAQATAAKANLHAGSALCGMSDGRMLLSGIKAKEQHGTPFADDDHVYHATWHHLDRVQIYDPRPEIEGPADKRWCKCCESAFKWTANRDDGGADTCPQAHPPENYSSRGMVPNPQYRAWKGLPPPPTPRASGAMATLQDGRVLIAGGRVPYTAPEQVCTAARCPRSAWLARAPSSC